MEQIILKIHQHKIKMILKTLKAFLVLWIIMWIFTFLISSSIKTTLIIEILTFIWIYAYNYFFWAQSYFLVTNEKLSINVRNWIFSQYSMWIYFDQIKDMAYSKNHFLHYLFNYWVLFVRSSAWSDWNFIVDDIPNIEEIYKKVSHLYALWNDRKNIEKENKSEKKLSKDEIIKNAKNILLNIPGIKEVEILDNADKKFIFENEEDKNHWVYECIKRQITFVATHDSTFRNADAPIVLKLWSKVIFPPVSFHEIKEKNTISSSPWVEVHNYLSKKFKNLDTYDATLLIWFDI